VQSLLKIGPVVLEKKSKKCTDGQTDGRRTTGNQKSSLELSAQVHELKSEQGKANYGSKSYGITAVLRGGSGKLYTVILMRARNVCHGGPS
jgi:hypothetical protein